MGRLHNADLPASSSHSLHTFPDDDDLPPPYTDEPDLNPVQFTSYPTTSYQPLRLVDSAYALPGGKGITICDPRAITLEPSLSRNSAELFNVIRQQTKLPLRPFLRIQGTHTESSDDAKKKSSNTVTDFFLQLDLAETLLTGWEGTPSAATWAELDVIRAGDDIPAFRGSRLRTRSYQAPALGRKAHAVEDTEAALLADDPGDSIAPEGKEADLKLWCERYCNDPSPVKSYSLPSSPELLLANTYRFTVHRELRGFDYNIMRNLLSSHIKSLNYLGSINIWLVQSQRSVTIYSPHWINRLRANKFIWWLCVLLQLWLITWPVIWFLEKRYEIVNTRWNASLDPGSESGLVKCYAQGRDEAGLAEFWSPSVKQAAWTRRQGEAGMLTKLDAERLQGLSRDELLGLGRREESDAERERRDRVHRGEGGFADGVVGLVRGVSEVRQDWRLAMGWGGDC